MADIAPSGYRSVDPSPDQEALKKLLQGKLPSRTIPDTIAANLLQPRNFTMRSLFFLLILSCLHLPAMAADLFLTHTHGRSGGSADTHVLVRSAPNDLENFSFVIAFAQDTLSFDRILEAPNTGWGWNFSAMALNAENGRDRIRISFEKNLADKALPTGRDYLLCDLRFSVKQNKAIVLYLEEPEGDMKTWRTENARFFQSDANNTGSTQEETSNISCFLDSLTQPQNP